MGISVCAQPCENPPVHQLHRRRASAGIAHIGLRIMDHHCIRFFNQIHFMGIDIDTVSQQRLLSQNAVIHQPVNNPFSIMLQTVMQIFDPLCHMDMIPCFIRFVRSGQFKRFIGNRKLRVHSHHTGNHSGIVF